MLEAIHLRKTYRFGWLKKRSFPVIESVSINVGKGETVGIVGRSGSGKSTLAFLLAGLLKPDSGQIYFDGRRILYPLNKDYRRRIQIIFQHPEISFNPLWTMERSMAEPFHLYRIPFSLEILIEKMRAVGLYPGHLRRYPSQLSGGELQRAAIARVMVLEPEFVVLDEPTSMLDTITQSQVIRLLMEIQREKGVAYLFISHDLELASFFCRRVYRLKDGKLEHYPG